MMDEYYHARYAHGSACFGSLEDARHLTKGDAPFAKVENLILRFRGEEPSIIFGGAGSGKGASIGVYVMSDANVGSLFVLDMSGQYMSTTWHYNLAINRKAFTLNVEGASSYTEINHPLDLWQILKDDEFLFDNAGRIASMALSDLDTKGDNGWVGQSARRWLRRFLIGHVLLEGRVTPKTLWAFINQIDADDEFLKDWGRSAKDLPFDIHTTMVEIYRKKHGSEKEYGAVMGAIKDNLDWLSSPKIADSVSGDEDYLQHLADPNQKVAVYYALKGGSGKQMQSLSRMVVGIAQLHCVRAGLGARPLFYLEEAASLGGVDYIKQAVSEFRKFFRCILVYQSYGQLEHYFQKAGAREIMDSCGMQIYLGGGIRDPESAKRLADAIGRATIYTNDPLAQQDRAFKAETALSQAFWNGEGLMQAADTYAHEMQQSVQQRQAGRYLIDPSEIMRLKNELIVLTPGAGLPPILAQKLQPYWTNPAMAGRYAPDPLFPPLDKVKIKRRFFGYTVRKFIRAEVPKNIAHWPNHVNGEIAYVKGYRTY